MADRDTIIRGLEDAIGLLTMCSFSLATFSSVDGEEKSQSVERMIEAVEGAIAMLSEYQIVRCADCQYYDKRGASGGLGWCSRPGAGCGNPENFYCAGGVRKDGGSVSG